jgi:hypothetical protein
MSWKKRWRIKLLEIKIFLLLQMILSSNENDQRRRKNFDEFRTRQYDYHRISLQASINRTKRLAKHFSNLLMKLYNVTERTCRDCATSIETVRYFSFISRLSYWQSTGKRERERRRVGTTVNSRSKSSYVSWQIDILAKTIEHTEHAGVCRNNNRSISYSEHFNPH